ncbi:hypothetical protein FACS1894170_01160 [Planctomycetales bacterium]|nr:hypothetical protein FACS1894170_01160 [Planctomycetales bacterium]
MSLDDYSWQDVCILYRVRWQIELLFKLWKSACGLNKSRMLKMLRVVCKRMTAFYWSFWLGEAATSICIRQIEADLMEIPIQHQNKSVNQANPYEKTRYDLSEYLWDIPLLLTLYTDIRYNK